MNSSFSAAGAAYEGAQHPGTLAFLSGAPKKLFIGGAFVEAEHRRTFPTINPANEALLTTISEGDALDADSAVRAARTAFEEGAWRTMRPHARGRTLTTIAQLVERHATELAELIVLDNGKPLREALAEVASAVECFAYYAGWTSKIYGETNPSADGIFNYTLAEPVGVCAAILPWNGPVIGPSMELGAALACGNSIILKPAEQASLATIRLVELIAEAQLPPGVVNLVTGFGPTAGAALVHHHDVDALAFTGSTEVGREILRASAGNMKRVSLELGGKSANLIFADANLELASQAAAAGIFANKGEVCCATSRVLVERAIHDEFVTKLMQQAQRVRLGAPFDPNTTMGPLVSSEQHKRVLGYLSLGRDEGATAVTGGSAGPFTKGYFVQPTIFTGVSNSMRIAQEEIFGPVVCVIPFTDETDAIRKANATRYGLAAALFTNDLNRAHRVSRALRAGTVWINNTLTLDVTSPFGGCKDSGFGRKRGKQSIEHYLHTKSVFLKFSPTCIDSI